MQSPTQSFQKPKRKSCKKGKYAHVSLEQKQQFLNGFFKLGQSISDSARLSGIKYATAKHVLFIHRRNQRNNQKSFMDGQLKNVHKQCGYKSIGTIKKISSSQVELIISIGNSVVSA